MLLNYLKSALRSIARHKGYSAINIFGLAIGLASSLAVFLWVVDEIGYDRFHANGEQIYRCNREVIWNNRTAFDEAMSMPVGPTIKERTPDVVECVRTRSTNWKLGYRENSTIEHGMYVDSAFLTMFSFPLVKGDSASALSTPNSIILTEKTAVKLFGNEDPMGQMLDNGLAVSGVARDVPANSSIEFDFLIPMAHAIQINRVLPDEWFHFGYETYFLMRENADLGRVGAQIKDLFKEQDPETSLRLHLQPLTDIHLVNPGGGGKIVYVYVFAVVAALLLVIACVNFMNLATARASRRMGEIGMRKVVGASRTELIRQILIESLVQTVTATLLAVCLLEIALPRLEGLFGKPLDLEFTPGIVLGLIALTVLVALIAGAYPAFLLSSFRPATVLKGKNTTGGHPSTNRLRRVLVVFQFMVSSGLIFSALVIYGQLNYIDNKELGVAKDNIITVRTKELATDYQTVKTELLQYPGITGVTAVMEPPAWCGWYVVGYDFEGKVEGEDIRAGFAWVDHDYLDVFGMEIIEGRNFSRQYATDETEAYIINQVAAEAMGMESPVGKSIGLEERPGRIIGVARDFHFASLHNEILPLVIGIDKSNFEFLCIKLAPDDIQGSLGFIEAKWKEFRPGEQFNYRFFDDLLSRSYRGEAQTGKIILTFTLVTVLVACLGLFGLAAFSAERRTKEIGIRKVLGSSDAGIIGLLTREFVLLVVLANAIVAPLAYYSAGRWLEHFAYRIELTWGTFALSSALAIMIALLTVCYQAIRAARANPVDALKYE
ncbi:MAG: ABC transporter permease [Candidatus Zixiibacteriota bacterium]|nr:MAG: ABC transporter permease [candidate division Zixibacteria bacterium]